MAGAAWYEKWFGDEYLQVYQHRDEAEARAAVDLVLRHRAEVPGPVLDLACGAGRHLAEFARRNVPAVGLDLSLPLLERAREFNPAVVRGDMRHLPFADQTFSLVASFFTSFGYFSDPEEDRAVVREVRRVLSHGGSFAFDFLNARRVRSSLPEADERMVSGMRIVQTRALTQGGTMVEKRIEIHDPSDRLPRVFYERVRLYEPDELTAILEEEQLRPLHRFGDYLGAAPAGDAPRFIVTGVAS